MEKNKKFLVLALTGAGISKSAGIPTFQDIPGIKEKLTIWFKKDHPDEFEETMNNMKDNVSGHEPTIAHRALAQHDIPVITMNVDSLHSTAGSKEIYEIHGSFKENNVVLYGQPIFFVNECRMLMNRIDAQARREDKIPCLLVIGTSLQTAFANQLVSDALSKGFYVERIDFDADGRVPAFLDEHC
jgi:NAD-dependent deacetylase